MGFKSRRMVAPTRESPVRALPICVFYNRTENGRGEGWCLCDGPPDAQVFSQKTRCGEHVMLPGRYEHRFPTCPKCITLIGTGAVDPAEYPKDLMDFLQCQLDG